MSDSIVKVFVRVMSMSEENGMLAEVGVRGNLQLGLGIEPAEHLAGGLFIPKHDAL